MSDPSRPGSFPRLTVTLDHETAQAVRAEAAARMQSRSDLVRDAVRAELRVRQVAAVAVARERATQAAAATRLARTLGSLTGRSVTIRSIAEHDRVPLARPTTRKESSE